MTKHKKSRLQRQSRTRRRSRQQRKRTMKRGGMLRHRAAVAARTFIYHDVLPLFTQLKTQIGKNPTPEQKAVVLKGERYFRSFADIPVDDAIKASIENLKKEWESTEQNAAKALDIYNKILQALKDAEEKRQKENITQTPGQPAHKTFSSPLYANSPSSLFLQGKSYGSQSLSSPSSSPFAHTPQNLTRPHFNTPSKQNSTTQHILSRRSEKDAQPIIGHKDLSIQGNQLFPNDENSTPINSPFKSTPGRVPSKSAFRSPFSPSRPPFLPRLNLPY